LREESEQLGGHISQDKVGTNPKGKFMCECCYHLLLLEVILYGFVQSIQQGERVIFEEACWHENQGCLECFLVVVGSYCSGSYNRLLAWFSRHCFLVGHTTV
jgi:hypothetical protein